MSRTAAPLRSLAFARAGPAMSRDPGTIARAYVEAINAEDWAGLRDLLSPDVTVRPAQGRIRRGVDDALEFWPKAYAPLARHHDTVRDVRVGADFAIADLWFEGQTREGAALAFAAMDVFEIDRDRIARLTIWLDPAAARQTAPAEGANR